MGQRRQDIRAMRSGLGQDISNEELDKPLKLMEEFDDSVAQKSQFFTSYNPDLVEDALVAYLASVKIEPIVSKGKYKVKFTLFAKCELDPEANDNVEMVVKILAVPDKNMYSVEFSRQSGHQTTFMRHV